MSIDRADIFKKKTIPVDEYEKYVKKSGYEIIVANHPYFFFKWNKKYFNQNIYLMKSVLFICDIYLISFTKVNIPVNT